MQQISVLETNIGSSTTGNSTNTQVIFNDNGTLRGDASFTFVPSTDILTVTGFKTFGTTQLSTIGILYVGTIATPKLKVDVAGTGITTITQADITGALTVDTTTLVANAAGYTDKVGVGTATPAATLHIKGSGRVDGDYNLFDFYKDNGSTRLGYLLFRDDGANYLNVNSNQPLYLSTNNTVKVQVETSGDVKINTGNLVMGTSGKGIDFSATANSSGTMTSELLNDYEEGTWTPTFTASSGTLTTVTSVSANYTKIGRRVSIDIDFFFSNIGTATGVLFLTLPFTRSGTDTCGAFREIAIVGSMGSIYGDPSDATKVCLSFYNNTSIIVNTYRFNGTYTYNV